MRVLLTVAIVTLMTSQPSAADQHLVTGLVLGVDATTATMVVSCDRVLGYMDAMVMRFSARDPSALDGVKRGASVEFTLVVDGATSYVQNVRVRRYENLEPEPLAAGRLKLLDRLSTSSPGAGALSADQRVRDFTLTDQTGGRLAFSQLAGRVVALTFTYVRCPNPSYCFRLASNFRQLQTRFSHRMGTELVLLTVAIDPQHDQGRALADYASQWTSDSAGWRFLTGSAAEIRRVSNMFGAEFWNDEGSVVHLFRTAVVDRQGRLVANLEGNQFTARQLGDLVQTVLDRHPSLDRH